MKTAFDIASIDYDTNFTFSKIGKAQRNLVFKYLNPILSEEKLSILELNCGTGEDAIKFSKNGHNVLATDVSIGMIETAKKKQYNTNCKFETLDISKISKSKFDTKFDIVFSNFGGFNCLQQKEIQHFFNEAQHILSKEGRIILVIMPKNTLWEFIYFSLKGQFKKATRRNKSNALEVNVEGKNVKTWYYNPKNIIALTSGYTTQNIKPIGLWIPPSYLEKSILGKKTSIKILSFLETIFSFSFLSKYADHFLIELKPKT